tara:strand:- start:888 stop:1139 length:252 start_codon:yes stop_codon:yes gene_type:complete
MTSPDAAHVAQAGQHHVFTPALSTSRENTVKRFHGKGFTWNRAGCPHELYTVLYRKDAVCSPFIGCALGQAIMTVSQRVMSLL